MKKDKEAVCLIMAVTNDKFELPMLIADTMQDMAVLLNSDRSTVSRAAHGKRGTVKKLKIVEVEL